MGVLIGIGMDLRPLAAALFLMLAARLIVRSAEPAEPKQKSPGSKHRPAEPAPIAGAASGLLESIPHLEAVRRGRFRVAGKLAMLIWLGAAVLAVALYGAGRALASWLSSMNL